MNPKTLSRGMAAALSLLGCCTPLAHAQAAPVAVDASTEKLSAIQALKIQDGTITLLRREEPSGQAPRTIVKLVLRPAAGSNIHVEIWLPDAEKWNSRFLALGNGGSAGRINSGSFAGPVAAGYAVATTDMGTAPSAASGIGNREVWKDFGFRATHVMTVAAKQVIHAYYGKAPEYSYFNGGSTGGQQALQEAQRYPEDYDGIVAAIPAHCRTPLHAYFLWNDQILKKRPFTAEQEANVIAAGKEYMAARETPPLAGKLVSDPRCDDKDIEAVVALALKKDPTLTADHAEALRKLFGGPVHAVTGTRIFNGIPFGSSISAAHGHLYLFQWVFGAGKKFEDINFGADIDAYTAALGSYLNAENADLSAFEKRGGKLIMTSGTEDSIVPYHASLDYYERVAEHFSGDIAKVKSFFRFYMVPGMGHGGGPKIARMPNLLEAVKHWRESRSIPEQIDGFRLRDGEKEIAVPLYAYPTQLGWDAEKAVFKPVEGKRGGVERVAEVFRPGAKE